jgi:aminoglycoside phosphotransferase (APT) family kinase protein
MDATVPGSGAIGAAELLAGGTQNILIRFRRGDREFVLRRPPRHARANSNETMRREARLLSAIASSDVPHPRLIAACEDEQLFGFAFYLMEPVDGFNATTGLPALHANSPEVRHSMGLALADAIASLAALDYTALGLQGFGKTDRFLERQVSRWKNQLASYGEYSSWSGASELRGVEEVGAWLDARRPVSFRPAIIHGDFHIANVMYRHDSAEIAAVVDWELTTIGPPLLDLGWLLATWPDADTSTAPVQPWLGFPTAEELVGRYQALTSSDLKDLNWYRVLACFKLGIILEGTHARACAGLAPRATGDHLHARAVSLLDRASNWIA